MKCFWQDPARPTCVGGQHENGAAAYVQLVPISISHRKKFTGENRINRLRRLRLRANRSVEAAAWRRSCADVVLSNLPSPSRSRPGPLL